MSVDIFWTNTLAGSTKQETCPGNQKGRALAFVMHGQFKFMMVFYYVKDIVFRNSNKVL